VCFRTRNSIRL
jgi:hypothetical protein